MELKARVIGLMSGTSADGVDAALVEFTEPEGADGVVEFQVLGHNVLPLPPDLRAQVLDACKNRADTQTICKLNFSLGEVFAGAANSLLAELNLPGSQVDLLASHGQTVWHQVEPGEPLSTLQIAEPAVIAKQTGITTASNFRVADVAAGGQGAPLASFFDYVFFADDHKTRALQNIGGIGNVTFLPAGGGPEAARAFDTGPGNVLMDFAAYYYTDGVRSYDRDGLLASAGKVDRDWLAELLRHPYFSALPPKSTGRELYSEAFWNSLREEAERRDLSGADTLATLTAFTASSIALSYERFGPTGGVDEVIVSGGGGKNPYLMELLSEALGPKTQVRLHDEFGLDSKLKEAVFFALFGFELLRGRPANLPSCTGAKGPVLLGQLTPGSNYASLLRRFGPYMVEELAPLKKLRLRR